MVDSSLENLRKVAMTMDVVKRIRNHQSLNQTLTLTLTFCLLLNNHSGLMLHIYSLTIAYTSDVITLPPAPLMFQPKSAL